MNYKIPFDFGAVMAGRPLETTTLQESIAQHLQTLIVTHLGAHAYDPGYGNAIWETEFDNGILDVQWEQQFTDAVYGVVCHYEPRLSTPRVRIHTEVVQRTEPMRSYTEIRKKVTVSVHAFISASGEAYSFRTILFISPLSTT